MLDALRSPCTKTGSSVCKYKSAPPTSNNNVDKVTRMSLSMVSWPLFLRSTCSPRTNCLIESPSTYSKIIANSPLNGSMVAPWNATICECRILRRSRISLQNVPIMDAWLRWPVARGNLMATVPPRQRPNTTQPKPPEPSSTEGKSSTSAVPTSQCSLTPTFAMRSKLTRSAEMSCSARPAHNWSMSLKMCSVAALEATLSLSCSSLT
mmetsp:Transcript_23898/g.69143  ORF Transcript_23898/g.69143 Transcript_23898/m.69143 type:complete len:208 (-) Transcript_23898:558-1181(-)